MHTLKNIINKTFDNKLNIHQHNVDQKTTDAINQVLHMLNIGKLRVSEKINGFWITHQWLKKAILLSFLVNKNVLFSNKQTCFYDKIKLKYCNYTEEKFKNEKIRIVPPATVRHGAFIGKNTILMPCYVNTGAYIDEGTMIDTWATVGSCAQIGKNVHLSGGVGIGGVLEPLQNNPTIIEDNCFIGARSEIVEGVIIESNSVISMGVFIGQSTKIYDRNNKKILYGKVPSGSVVVPGSLPSKNNCNLYCVVIVKQVNAQTLSKTGINKLLREITE
ncbi:2,3,4,5-tetrahydropyridine-2-carboxylate N-succinyltransferase [Buchnera aphidicola str. Bp (Baizongia pistaciae)]|uniref:2,3,4,5-tetrahydropyridine-2,6-dicarboxylate N-succinyltransferase n=1 Tax=Buchnera aphidicola subsp. Baizongia pistaciae (strain Bp) TaxID=224915 RepID=DAPD_BUCBP|nr:2,3,4,5-tetrahydropyridine-2,6-dicarboxylate N-succinyltransferase [Buchnera aphidicola]Q89AP4.1 RecName: Full=2,3,4,5-tetrahydropyridine-2,6-dicarboxylate N-succinyltransferase; AltName: Full=Tetrahydrodipicolinate N-succinyltransferase; Short=THDP succinyltransferase; Short=THP succinyltransferase; Short=Tetrahydropicolinate succinylase [Buchnera aphidicola str. Bp (Baizongia pistaciae)]AAO26943.1 2,3,4,5-tetrahydropyridine-2-carboxylate N-succinyltransferase [Buchnera aphidicola str. Bp (Ba